MIVLSLFVSHIMVQHICVFRVQFTYGNIFLFYGSKFHTPTQLDEQKVGGMVKEKNESMQKKKFTNCCFIII